MTIPKPFNTPQLAGWAVMLLLCVVGIAQIRGQQVPDWENPEVFNINMEPPHATLIPYANEEECLRLPFKASPFYKSLNGQWKFKWSPNPACTANWVSK